MNVEKSETIPIRAEADIVTCRQKVRTLATELRFSLVDQTKIVTAASELARNTLVHGGGGQMRMEVLEEGLRHGLRLHFEDEGPGIADIGKALQDGFTTGSGLGLGFGGAKRLVNEFEVFSAPGMGTKVIITRWK